MEAAKEDTISHYLPILDDLSIQRTVPKGSGLNYISDLCILFIIKVKCVLIAFKCIYIQSIGILVVFLVLLFY